MFYGNAVYKENIMTKTISNIELFESVAYEEYCNRKTMLEACVNDSDERPILEAQVQILQEISIKDILGKIKTFILKVINAIKEIFNKIKNKLKNTELKKQIAELKNENESLRKASEIAEKKAEIAKNIANNRDQKIANDNTRFIELFNSIANSKYMYFNANDFIESKNSSDISFFKNFDFNGSNEAPEFTENDAKEITDNLQGTFKPQFKDCFQFTEIPLYSKVGPAGFDNIKIPSGFQGYGDIIDKAIDKNTEKRSDENNFIWAANKLEELYKLDNVTLIENKLNFYLSMLETLNRKIPTNQSDNSGNLSKNNVNYIRVLKTTISTIQGIVGGLNYLNNIAIAQHSFLFSSSKQLLIMCKSLKGDRQSKEEEILKNSPLYRKDEN